MLKRPYFCAHWLVKYLYLYLYLHKLTYMQLCRSWLVWMESTSGDETAAALITSTLHCININIVIISSLFCGIVNFQDVIFTIFCQITVEQIEKYG